MNSALAARFGHRVTTCALGTILKLRGKILAVDLLNDGLVLALVHYLLAEVHASAVPLPRKAFNFSLDRIVDEVLASAAAATFALGSLPLSPNCARTLGSLRLVRPGDLLLLAVRGGAEVRRASKLLALVELVMVVGRALVN